MKLLFDQNLSRKLPARLAALYPGSSQVWNLGMHQASDANLWQHARQHDYIIVTQDGDFSDLSCLEGWPPKVIWLRCGNQPSAQIERLLRSHHDAILRFATDPDTGVLEIP